ncbi:MAG: DUF3106 domain-containing protein [Planctomycetota bacterium]
MVDRDLTRTQREQLSAYLDGQLPSDEAAAVAERIADDPRWRKAAAEYERLDAVLDRWTAPRMQRDLTAAILSEARRKPPRPAWVRWLAPLSAAAAIVVAVMLSIDRPAPRTATDAPLAERAKQAVRTVPREDRFVVKQLDIFANYDVLANFDTLRAMEDAADAEPDEPAMVSVDRQRRVKRRLLGDDESLLAALQRWKRMTPTQQEQLRHRAYAFREADATHRREILAAWEAFWRMDDDQRAAYRDRAKWVKAVIDTLTEAERERLLALSAAERAKELLRLRDELTDTATRPADEAAPAPTRPADD